ncbi:lasso RiPP family leader peptide-containing protein [Streptomyces rimosus]|nr:lasso RiPP family leader peptide-containing protein [Streptomyces rimosus]
MQENWEEADYEAPELAEVGDFAEVTHGYSGLYWDGYSAFFGLA